MRKLINIQARLLGLFLTLGDLEIKGKKGSSKYQKIIQQIKEETAKEEIRLQLPLVLLDMQFKYEYNQGIASKIDSDLGTRFKLRARRLHSFHESINKNNQKVFTTTQISQEVTRCIQLFAVRFLYDYVIEAEEEIKTEYDKKKLASLSSRRRGLIETFYRACYATPGVEHLVYEDLAEEDFYNCFSYGQAIGYNHNELQDIIDEISKKILYDLIREICSLKYEEIAITCMVKAVRMLMSKKAFESVQASPKKLFAKDISEDDKNRAKSFIDKMLSDATSPKEMTPFIKQKH